MVIVEDMRPIFYTGRVFGTLAFVVREDNVQVQKIGVVYMAICASLYLMTAVMNMYFFATDESALDEKLMILVTVRTVLSYACLLADIVLTVAWNHRIRTALSQLRSFDRATRFNNSRGDGKISTLCCLTVCAVITFWATVGYITYRYDAFVPLFNGLLYGVINAAISIQILTFVAISFLLYVRFRQLCRVLFLSGEGKITVEDRTSRQFKLQEIWWLHYCLVDATETINSVYATQLLLWIACMSFNTLSRIYSINENSDMPIMLKIRESFLVTACVANLLLITVTCHATASQANRVGRTLFSPLSLVVGKRNFAQDNVEAATYFQLQKVHFFAAAGLIRIDLPLLLSIASGITTYLVILHTGSNG